VRARACHKIPRLFSPNQNYFSTAGHSRRPNARACLRTEAPGREGAGGKDETISPGLSKAGAAVSNEDQKSHQSSSRRWEEGRYANFFQIGHNAFEFLLEFGQQEGDENAIHTRIYVSPQHARILGNLLLDTLQQHERIFGRILSLVPKEPGS
jgi:hypothetical protein